MLLIMSVVGIICRDLLVYGFQQGKGQFYVLRNARPIDDFIADDTFPDSLKQKIKLIQEAKSFGADLGLKETANYQTIFDQKGKSILWNVSGCKPFEFEPYYWSFPFTGKVPYKGFFDIEKAKKEARELKKKGYDVRVRSVSAWSTLGWFKDPILSNMLFRSEGELAETIFHELTHTTLFFPDSVDFNENLASFYGKKATEVFLEKKYGSNSEELKKYLAQEADKLLFRTHMLKGRDTLNSLYNSFTDDLDTMIMREEKENLIHAIIQNMDSIDFENKDYSNIFIDYTPNNAYFMSFSRYYDKMAFFDSIYVSQGEDLKNFLAYFSEN